MYYPFHAPKDHRGYILVLALVFLGILSAVASAYLGSVTSSTKRERYDVESAQALAIAEAGMDQAAYQLNQNPSYTSETNTALGAGTFTTTVTSINGSSKRISVTASVPNNTSPLATKTIKATVSINNASISFRYGVQ